MRKIKAPFKSIAIITLLVTTFIACDKDYATIGSDIIGQNNFIADSIKYEVTAYTKKIKPVQTNNLPINYLGVYNDPLYGLTTANFVTQISPNSFDPDFGENPEIDSVIMTIPYFSKLVDVNADGENIYELDSVFGSSPIKLSIHENNYFLRNFNPDSEFNDVQNYFSNASTSSSNNIDPSVLEGTLLYPLDATAPNSFTPSNEEIILTDVDDEVTSKLAPSFRVALDSLYWTEKIIAKEGETVLSNQNNFYNYFRGLYFKTEAIANNGTMMMLNFKSANITIYYSKDSPVTDSEERVSTTFVMPFSGNNANFLINEFNLPLQDGDPINGDEKLYLKGGEGSMAVINLFNGDDTGSSIEFQEFKNAYVQTDDDGNFLKAKRLINEANLIFYVDQPLVQNLDEPNRLYLYDLKNNAPLVDYFIDSANNLSPNDSRTAHLGKLQREGGSPTGHGIKYKIRITDHLNSILLRDSTNVKLGLVVSGNVNIEESIAPYQLLSTTGDEVTKIPVSSIITPKSTVLYGNNTTNEAKKLYLEILYTEPNN